MRIRLKGNKIVLSEAPLNDVEGAFFVKTTNPEGITIDAKKGKKQYEIPGDITRKDIQAIYLRVL